MTEDKAAVAGGGPIPSGPAGQPARKAAFGFIFATSVMNAISFGLMIPVLPNLVKSFVGGDTAKAAVWTMIFGLTWGTMQFLWGPVLGSLSDRFGRRPVLLISIFGLAIDFTFMAFAPTIWWLLVGRVVNGLTAASFSTANAYVADITPGDDRARRYGLMGSAFSFGFLIGPVIGGSLGLINLRVPFMVAAGLALANGLYGLFILPESLPADKRMAKFQWSKANPVASLQFVRDHGSLMGLAAIYFLFMLSQSVWPNVFVLYAGYRFHWNTATVGLVLMINGGGGIISQIFLVGPVVRRVGERGALLIGAASGIVALLVTGLATEGWMYFLGMPFWATSNFLQAGLMGLMSRRVGPSEQGRLQGSNQSLQGITSVLGPLVYGGSFAWAVRNDPIFHQPGLPMLISASLLVVALGLGLRFAHPIATPVLTPAE
jgi:DHA1 family tetracycline resistance protein-like MFS transporter